MTIHESPLQIYYMPDDGTDYKRYIIPDMNITELPHIIASKLIVYGTYGHQNFNQPDFYDDSKIYIMLLSSYKIDIYYGGHWFRYRPTDNFEKFTACLTFLVSCYKHYHALRAVDELD